MKKLLSIISILAFLLPFNVFATPVIEANGGSQANNALSLTYAINIPAGLSNSTLIVSFQNSGGPGAEPTGITWNTTENLTFGSSATPYLMSGYFYLNNPISGNHNIVITYSNTRDVWSIATVLSGADITGNPVSNSGFCGTNSCVPAHSTVGPIENMFNTTLNELVLDNVYYSCAGDPITAFGTNQSEIGTGVGSCADTPEVHSSSKTATSTGSTAMWESLTSSPVAWGSFGISVKSVSAPPSVINPGSQLLWFE